ncbi:uncharacterized protein LOC122388100 [Amphibalanus amphitrite]|uniref:uncharacterized protein LOC122388100 n=1 Tax=Amphibalanus amphitrite TaxID=1232801 RepID=UPI001C919FF7|nr:uncharacterized protein LOC122388100 [Amphibalanus amphitrite]
MPPGQKDVQRRENDYQRLIQEIAPLLEKTDRSVLQAVAQEFTACTLSGRLSVKEMLEQLERTAVLSPNAVKVLQTVCEIVDCREGNQLVSEYLKKYPPYSGRRTHSHSAPAALYPGEHRGADSQLTSNSDQWFSADSNPTKHRAISEQRIGGSDREESVCNQYSFVGSDLKGPWDSVGDPEEVKVLTDYSVSSISEDVRRTSPWQRSSTSGSVRWPPLESTQSSESPESRQRSMALWGHSAAAPAPAASPASPAAARPATSAVCECHHPPRVQPASPPRQRQRLSKTVDQALELRPGSSAGGSRSGGAPAVMRGVTPAGARRARLVDFLSSRLGPRFVELGEQMERVSRAELADISSDTSADMVSQARRLLGLFLSRHQSCDGDAEILLVRRLRRIRFNRLADELEIWSADQDRWEDPRDWSEDKRRWRSSESHQHRSPVRIPRAACC